MLCSVCVEWVSTCLLAGMCSVRSVFMRMCVHVYVFINYIVIVQERGKQFYFQPHKLVTWRILQEYLLKKTPLYVGVDDHRDTATVEG